MPDIPGKPPIVIAHRGASAYLPEHSLPSKALAYGMGADYLEQDIVISRDGELLVLHDLILDHVSDVAVKFPGRQRADGHFYCIDFDLREIRTLRFTERVKPGTQVLRYAGRFPRAAGSFPIVTFSEEIEFVRGLNQATGRSVGIFLEIKKPAWHREQGVDLPSRVLAELADLSNLLERIPVFLACFDADELRKIHKKVDPGFTIIQLLSSKTLIDAGLLADIAAYANGIGPSIQLIYQGKHSAGQPRLTDLVRQAHALGLGVYPYTFRADDLPDGMETFEELLELFIVRLEVDGLISDFTDRVVAFRQQQFAGRGK
jgi:glycerophosphoryl diester phosphodiesterase